MVVIVTKYKTIKISSETYEMFNRYAGELRKKRKKSVSIDDVIKELFMKKKPSEMASSWKVDDEELKEINKSLKKAWGKWRKSF